jgi:hypothetical protein
MHGSGRQQHGEVPDQSLPRTDRPQLQRAAPADDFVEHVVQCQLILAGSLGNSAPDYRAILFKKG